MDAFSAHGHPRAETKPSSRPLLDRVRKNALPYLFVAPMAAAVILIIVVPILRNMWMSFFDWYLARPTNHAFLGLANYAAVLRDPVFRTTARVTAIYLGVTLPARFVLGLGIALLLMALSKGAGSPGLSSSSRGPSLRSSPAWSGSRCLIRSTGS